ncbi:MAG: phosphoribosylformimino-5-aminoimidazole carboxamide ribotide isomerase [Catonella sp.]|nr:phosphoribosylformimino-5-aminoimidazole carboxamide ribotide isomerase [Catonella sp.]
MRLRPCIDIHNGEVAQIVGSTLKDEGNSAKENFKSERHADYYATLYKKMDLPGGHIILLNKKYTEFYDKDVEEAKLALAAYPGGMQIGGGIIADNAARFIEMGASHVIVTSYAFADGKILYDNLTKLVKAVGKEHIVLDLSARMRENRYFIVTDRWQNFTEEELSHRLLEKLEDYCDEFLIHAVDSEGKKAGIDDRLAGMLGSYDGIPVTYAGGVSSIDDIERLNMYGNGRLDVTIGSALDIFGGNLPLKEAAGYIRAINNN